MVASQEELARRKNRVKESSTSDELEVRLMKIRSNKAGLTVAA